MERLTEKFKDRRNILRKGISDIFYIGFGRFFEGEAIDRLAEYEDLEDQNRLIKLPCKSGQKVYLLRKDIKSVIDGEITSIIIAEFASDMKIFIIDDNRYTRISFDKIGDIVFFTREEAEAALKELERGNGE